MKISAFACLYEFRSYPSFDTRQIVKFASFSVSFTLQIKILFIVNYILVGMALRKKIWLSK